MNYLSTNEKNTQKLGTVLALTSIQLGCPQLTIYLKGEIGSGKSVLARSFIKTFGINHVPSPTYTLINSYPNPHCTLHHWDCYRLDDASEIEAIGLRDYLNEDTIHLIEWPEIAESTLPTADLSISYTRNHNHPEHRNITLKAYSKIGTALIQEALLK